MENDTEISIRHTFTDFGKYVLIEFICGNLTHNMLSTYIAPDPVALHFSNKGVIIKGAMPLWFCAFLTHAFHATRFVAIFEPRIPAAIVIESHVKEYKPGDLIALN